MKKVTILLSTYNGEKYLREQLDSLLLQEGVEFNIFVRDDGSKDKTCDILQEYAEKGLLTYIKGENVGFSKSFSWLINNAPSADYYSCCDQDDVWLPTKILDGVTALEKIDQPATYFTSLNVVDEKLNLITKDSHSHYNNDSETLFADNILMPQVNGCTMIFNEKLRELYSQIPVHNVYAHDYTLITLASAFGKVVFSNDSKILYRQHANNCYGFYKGSLRNLVRSVKSFFKHETKGIKSHEAMNFKYYFFDKLKEGDRLFIDLITDYRFNKGKRKQLRKYIKKNIKNSTIRKFSLFLLSWKKL
ncbi:MAG: glycosyltransferase [Clostridia bacterium]|nr:glycosyltransferase [Clostridia bacterium]